MHKSGRNFDGDAGGRIEEHGLHLMLGFYENTFAMLRATMAEWALPQGHPWSTKDPRDRWTKAFTPAWFAPLAEQRPDKTWDIWPIRFPELSGTPGDGTPPHDDLIDFLDALRAWLRALLDMMKAPDPDARLREFLAGRG